jgi:type I restriction enzyme, S subunit
MAAKKGRQMVMDLVGKLNSGVSNDTDLPSNQALSSTDSASQPNTVNLPEGWTLMKVGEVALKINPGFPSGQHNQENRGIPHLRPMNISRNGEIDLSQVKYIEINDFSPLLANDVLFNNTNSPELVGKTSYIKTDTNWAYSNHMTRIRPRLEIVLASWLAYSLHYLYIIGYFLQNCRHHVNQASISSSYLANEVTISIPPISEQERIVAKIEELFTQLEAGTAALKRVQAGLKRYKASVLKAAVEGRLVDGGGRVKEGELPEGWRWVKVSQIGLTNEQTVLTGPFGSNLGRDDFIDSGVPVLTIGCLTEQGLSLEKAKYISKEKAKELDRYTVREGDLLFSRMATVGRAGLVTKKHEGLIFNYHLMRLRLSTTIINPYYFLAYTRGGKTVTDYVNEVNHGATRDGINTEQLLALPIPLPPLTEQQQIVAEIERRLSLAQEIESVVEGSLKRASRLRQAVLKAAFEGRLM